MSDERNEQKRKARRAEKQARKEAFLAGVQELLDAALASPGPTRELEALVSAVGGLWTPDRDGLIESVDAMLIRMARQLATGHLPEPDRDLAYDPRLAASDLERALAYACRAYHGHTAILGPMLFYATYHLRAARRLEAEIAAAAGTVLGRQIIRAIETAGGDPAEGRLRAAFALGLHPIPGERVSIHGVRGVQGSWLAPWLSDREWRELRIEAGLTAWTNRVRRIGGRSRDEVEKALEDAREAATAADQKMVASGHDPIFGAHDALLAHGCALASAGLFEDESREAYAREMLAAGRYSLEEIGAVLHLSRKQIGRAKTAVEQTGFRSDRWLESATDRLRHEGAELRRAAFRARARRWFAGAPRRAFHSAALRWFTRARHAA